MDLTNEGSLGGHDPMEAFLTDFKRGHCEYFAGAMTLMCQSLGIPARFVVGFHCEPDDFNSIGDYFEVKQSDAHAWCEVYTGRRWETFDPTSGRGAVGASNHPWFSEAKKFIDYLEFKWANTVVAYDTGDRRNLIYSLDWQVSRTAVGGSQNFEDWIYDFQKTLVSPTVLELRDYGDDRLEPGSDRLVHGRSLASSEARQTDRDRIAFRAGSASSDSPVGLLQRSAADPGAASYRAAAPFDAPGIQPLAFLFAGRRVRRYLSSYRDILSHSLWADRAARTFPAASGSGRASHPANPRRHGSFALRAGAAVKNGFGMKAIVVSIGDELVLGQTVDTNSAWLSGELATIGWAVEAHVTVGDDQAAIEAAVAGAAARCDVILLSGGLGPTQDDLTRQALARVLNRPLEMNADWLATAGRIFSPAWSADARGQPRSGDDSARARLLHNSAGTASGVDADLTSGSPPRSCRIFAMPGVPREMKLMFQKSVAPHLAGGGGAVILSRTLHTFGVGESTVSERLGDLMQRGRNPSVGTTVSGGVVSVRINARFTSLDRARRELDQTAAQCREALGDLIYGSGEQTLASVVAELLTAGKIRTVATAESCTGGLLAKMLTDIPGSSRYFQKGWITYSNQAKSDLLDVDAQLVARDGGRERERGAGDGRRGTAKERGGFRAGHQRNRRPRRRHARQARRHGLHRSGTRRWHRRPHIQLPRRPRNGPRPRRKMALTLLRFQCLQRTVPF